MHENTPYFNFFSFFETFRGVVTPCPPLAPPLYMMLSRQSTKTGMSILISFLICILESVQMRPVARKPKFEDNKNDANDALKWVDENLQDTFTDA